MSDDTTAGEEIRLDELLIRRTNFDGAMGPGTHLELNFSNAMTIGISLENSGGREHVSFQVWHVSKDVNTFKVDSENGFDEDGQFPFLSISVNE